MTQTKEVIFTAQAPRPSGGYSQAIRLGDMVYVSGVCPFDLTTGDVLHSGEIAEQTRLVLHYMEQILLVAGSSMDRVVKVTSYIDELDEFQRYDDVYRTCFSEQPPARSTVEIVKFPPGMRVEIECIAYI